MDECFIDCSRAERFSPSLITDDGFLNTFLFPYIGPCINSYINDVLRMYIFSGIYLRPFPYLVRRQRVRIRCSVPLHDPGSRLLLLLLLHELLLLKRSLREQRSG